MKIVVLDGYTENPGDLSWAPLEELGELKVYKRTNRSDEKKIARRIKGANAVLTNKTPLSAAVIRGCKSLKYIGVLATGYNVVDLDAAAERGIPVCNIPAYGTAAVGQYAIGLLLEICHHIGDHSRAVHKGRWQDNKDWCFWDYPLIELDGKTMGIIGFGRIGQTTGRIAKAMGMKILANDEVQIETDIARYVTLDELYEQSDVICLHCPLFDSTEGMINAAAIDKMKDGVILINNARGPLVVEKDLADALKSGKVYAAGLDVVSTEPIAAGNPLLKAPRCIITPHISWAPRETRQRLMDIAVESLRSFINGKTINAVNL